MKRKKKKAPRKRRSYASMMRAAVARGLITTDLYPEDGHLAQLLGARMPAR